MAMSLSSLPKDWKVDGKMGTNRFIIHLAIHSPLARSKDMVTDETSMSTFPTSHLNHTKER